ncbi:plastidial pyruvate kinase 4, chloroplastic [Malania oleifera]|uniref:plastidial pyruvate kinase 4, chloroplastic n=1 Tax=Malania oleifera TaxID=397392 RepID=UPI0025AE5BF8|nr:plastidial pyruvate kinase 4, chloroplastic [Malania oleifera]XP_057950417.1 plastidial pyruvate kinase 4, chloroplastic [Malania oleifera]XP_057950418.1 plastidial pyruvate kinase 4, chloroplastic [Malania oleifera]
MMAIQIANFSDLTSFNLSEKFTHMQCRFHVKQPVFRYEIVQSLAGKKGCMRSKIFLFAIPNGSDKLGSGSLDCSNDEVSMALENNESSVDPNVEVDSILLPESYFSQNREHLSNQGNLLDKLKAVHLHVLALEQWNASRLKLCHRNYLVSATNLIHYLALKCLDVEQLKEDLSSVGLLNLETINLYVFASLTAGIQMLESLKFNTPNSLENVAEGACPQKSLNKQIQGEFTIDKMRKKASSNKQSLLGSLRDDRTTHIMVTLGQEAVESDTLITDLLKRGTTIFRINCAHGNRCVWSEVITRIKQNSQMLEKPCRIIMDLAGPKLRTGNLKAGPCVMKISPKKNATGDLIYPAQIWLSQKGAGPPPSHLSFDAVLSIDGNEFFNELDFGDIVRFFDARGKQRTLKISKRFHALSGAGFLAECGKTAYVQSATELYVKRKKKKFLVGQVVDVPPVERFLRLRVGDLLIISRDGCTEQDEQNPPAVGAHRVTCSSGYLFDSVKPGEPIAFDDGKIWGVIQGTSISEIIVSITHAGLKGTKLGSEKSINIPSSNIRFEGLTSKDIMDLEFVAAHADMVGVSFVRDIRDIVVVCRELEKRKLQNLGIVLKIETKGGFEKLPLMLLEAMKSPNPLGVMIARGDLAVECGWESLADMQEQILSICGAAHIPVIWATQVLESLVKSGVPTRAEITDVASGKRASCIMLNKGKNILEAVSTLDTILHSSSTKMKAELKPLVLSSHLF